MGYWATSTVLIPNVSIRHLAETLSCQIYRRLTPQIGLVTDSCILGWVSPLWPNLNHETSSTLCYSISSQPLIFRQQRSTWKEVTGGWLLTASVVTSLISHTKCTAVLSSAVGRATQNNNYSSMMSTALSHQSTKDVIFLMKSINWAFIEDTV